MNSMSDENEVPDCARQYQWYTGYDREDEYEKNPQWAVDMRTEVVDEEDENENTFTNPTVKFYDRFDPEHMWIKSDTTHDLTNTL